jgi:hypothetical protein
VNDAADDRQQFNHGRADRDFRAELFRLGICRERHRRFGRETIAIDLCRPRVCREAYNEGAAQQQQAGREHQPLIHRSFP